MNASHVPSPTRVRFWGTDEDGALIPEQSEYTPDDIVRFWNSSSSWSVLLLENPDPVWSSRLLGEGIEADIPQSFWDLHSSEIKLEGRSLWKSVFSRSKIREPRRHMHSMRGVFEYGVVEGLEEDTNNLEWQRPAENTIGYGWTSATRITYGYFDQRLIFVVDAPRSVIRADREGVGMPGWTSPNQRRPVLRLPYVTNTRGGVLIPHLFMRDKHSLFESFEVFLSHLWQLDALEQQHYDPDVLLTLLSSSLWQTNLGLLKKDIEHISFVEMRNRNRSRREQNNFVNDRLHDRREDLAFLRREVQYLIKWMRVDLKPFSRFRRNWNPNDEEERDEVNILDEVSTDSHLLQQFLMDTFQLWMAIMQFENTLLNLDQARLNNQIEERSEQQARATRVIMEMNQDMARDGEKRAEESAKQTSRATALTLLAALYLPTTLASGIFGMNVKEISESNLATLAEFGATLAGLVSFTVLCMLGYYYRERHLEAQEKARADSA